MAAWYFIFLVYRFLSGRTKTIYKELNIIGERKLDDDHVGTALSN